MSHVDITDAEGATQPVAVDIVGTDKHQLVKVEFGDIGVATQVSATNPLPVSAAISNTSVSVDDGGNSVTVDGTVSVGSAPGAARTTDSVSAALAVDAIMNGLTAVAPQYAKIVASASGATTIVSAVTSKKIVVLKWDLVTAGAVNVKWQSHVTPTDLTGLYNFAANGGIASGFCPVGHFATIAGEALDINLSGAVAVAGVLTYVAI